MSQEPLKPGDEVDFILPYAKKSIRGVITEPGLLWFPSECNDVGYTSSLNDVTIVCVYHVDHTWGRN